MEKKFVFALFGVVVLSVFLLFVSGNQVTIEVDPVTNNEKKNEDVPSRDLPVKINTLGEYTVKDDKKSRLIIKDNGEYTFFINACNSYLEVSGKYILADKKLKLINDSAFIGYTTLEGNTEFSFTVIDDDMIRLDEDLECLYQNTLFEK